MSNGQTGKISVFYDGSCPLCTREVSFYKRCGGADEISWIDVSKYEPGIVAPGLSREAALARFTIRAADHKLYSGAAAFTELWKVLPSFRLLGQAFQYRPLVAMLEVAYRLFLKVRKVLRNSLPQICGHQVEGPLKKLRSRVVRQRKH